MSLPVTIDTAFKRTYSDNFEAVFQQTKSELADTVRNGYQAGEMKLWDFIGETSGQWDLPRGSATPDIPTVYTRRQSVLRRWNWGEYIDEFDKVQTLKDPTNEIMAAVAASAQRAKDELLLQAIAATVKVGKDAGTTVNSYDVGECRLINGDGTEVTAGSNFAGSTETGLTLAKIGLIKKLLDDASVPAADRHLVANIDQQTYLLGSTKATSGDYTPVRNLVTGSINSYMGFQFHWLPSDRMTANATDTGCWECAAYHKSSVLLATNKGFTTSIDTIPERLNSTLCQAEMFVGAVRLHGPGVVRILLKKAPGVDFAQS